MPMLTLIGYRGTGKSVVTGRLAEHLATSWVDADAVLEERSGCTIAELVRERGEAAFRDAEESLLTELVGTVRGVLATGGGVVLREGNRRLLRERSRPVVWLTAAAAEIRRRLAADPATCDRRPALAGVDPLAEVDEALLRREPLYRSCADRIVDTSSRTSDEVAREIADWLARGAAATGSGGAAG